MLFFQVKQSSLEDMHKPVRRIVDDAMLQHIEQDDHQLPKVINLKRQANRVRADLRPDEPTSLEFEVKEHSLFLKCFSY